MWFRGELLYQYGSFDEHGRGKFEGWPWHEIPLPDGYEGETMYFRVFSNYTDIGLWGEVAILDHPDLVLHIVGNSAESLVIAALSGLIALLALVFALIQRGQRSFASIALFAFLTGVMLLAESQDPEATDHAKPQTVTAEGGFVSKKSSTASGMRTWTAIWLSWAGS